jgi:hypothetical protein
MGQGRSKPGDQSQEVPCFYRSGDHQVSLREARRADAGRAS